MVIEGRVGKASLENTRAAALPFDVARTPWSILHRGLLRS